LIPRWAGSLALGWTPTKAPPSRTRARAGSCIAAPYYHVDVFADNGYSGNSLAVFIDPPPLRASQMLRITQELRHFETVFVTTALADPGTVRARVFDLFSELDFAGHPVLGAAGVLHELRGKGATSEWTVELNARTVRVTTRRDDRHLSAVLDQGRPELITPAAPLEPEQVAGSVGLAAADLDPELLPQVVSTGLRYLIIPVRAGALARARIARADFEAFLAEIGAQFAYVLDAAEMEGRHWNNDGVLEDIATGSAAGCVAGYLLRHSRMRDGVSASLAQGRFAGRPSHISITAYGTADDVSRVTVGGAVSVVGDGMLRTLPALDQA
jgi:trans-2,3-dihydro-3-hydroxyanthranilate isomerase